MPSGPWIMYQGWEDLLFAHWRVSIESLRERIPSPLVLDLFDGQAFVGLVPFVMTGVHARGLPALPGLARFPELNLRTYVRLNEHAGVFFFSLDADNAPAVVTARTFYRLPYHAAAMSAERRGEWIQYRSRRRHGNAEFVARYRPVGDVFVPRPGSLEHFLTERYALFTVLRDGRALRADIHHPPWRLRAAELEIERNTVSEAAGIVLPAGPPLLHFSELQETLVWPPRI
jgi:uncharacterized protein YqjF (DUF2071 family)